MPEIPRLNGVIKALEQGTTAFVGFAPVDIEHAVALAGSPLDGVAFEMEHAPLTTTGLRDALQYMLDRRQILDAGFVAQERSTAGQVAGRISALGGIIVPGSGYIAELAVDF